MPDARLLIHLPGAADREIRLTDQMSVGRAFDNLIRLDSRGVSRYHAIIEKRAGDFWLSELGSTYGTTVNGEPLASERRLAHGDCILLGGAAQLEFQLDDPAPTARLAEPATATPSLGAAASATPPAPPLVQPSRTSASHIMIGAAIGIVVVAVVAIVLVSLNSGGPGKVRLISPENGALISERATARVQADKPDKIKRVIYQLNGVEVAASSTPPDYAASLDLDRLKEKSVALDGSPKLSAVVEDQSGARTNVPDVVALAFNPGEKTVTPQPLPAAPIANSGGTSSAIDYRALASELAYQITKQRDYVFSPEFINQIQTYTQDYLDANADWRCRREIARAFSTEQGLSALLGLVTAMSRTKFRAPTPRGGEADPELGLFRIPKSIVMSYPGESEAALNDLNRSTTIAAAYMKDILYKFRYDQADFMYAVACYGMPINKVGEIILRLDQAAADLKARKDFWRMVQSGVVDKDAAARVARFFAAGIVGLNPQRFNLNFSPLNSL